MTIEELNKIVKSFNNGVPCCIKLGDVSIYSQSGTYIEVNKYGLGDLKVVSKQNPNPYILCIHNILKYNLTIDEKGFYDFTFYELR